MPTTKHTCATTRRLRRGIITTVIAAVALAGVLWPGAPQVSADEPIKVGVLHSLSGTMAISEGPLKEVILMAIDEINAAGGVLGRRETRLSIGKEVGRHHVLFPPHETSAKDAKGMQDPEVPVRFASFRALRGSLFPP